MRNSILLSTAALILAAGCASMPAKATAPRERTREVASKITEAEQLGAAGCAPRTLAKAKVALDHVLHEMDEGYYPPAWLEPRIAAAETAAEDLLTERRFAASLGTRFRCGSAPRNDRAGGS